MAAGRIVIPQWMPALSANGIPIPNAKMFFYENKTTTLKTVYADEGLTTPLANPVAANSDGKFPLVWGDASDLYSVVIEAPYGPPGVPFTYDDVRPGGIRATGGYAGGWDASANVPEIISGVGDEGTWYTVEVAGSTTIDGISTWEVGDQILFSAGSWTRVPSLLLARDGSNISPPSEDSPSGAVALRRAQNLFFVTPEDFGGRSDDPAFDNAPAIARAEAYLALAGNGGALVFGESRSYYFASTITITRNGATLKGSRSRLIYNGTATSIDLLVFGNGVNEIREVNVDGLEICTETNMAAPSTAVHLKKVVRSNLRFDNIQGQYWQQTHPGIRIWHGVWANQVDNVRLYADGINATGDGIRVNGAVGTSGPKADFWPFVGKVSGAANGLLLGGGFGGLYLTPELTLINNKVNLRVDQSLCAEQNRELFCTGTIFDVASGNQATDANIILDDPGDLRSNFTGCWMSAGQSHGVWIKRSNGKTAFTGGRIIGMKGDAFRTDVAGSGFTILAGMQISDNTGWAINGRVNGHSVIVDACWFAANTLGMVNTEFTNNGLSRNEAAQFPTVHTTKIQGDTGDYLQYNRAGNLWESFNGNVSNVAWGVNSLRLGAANPFVRYAEFSLSSAPSGAISVIHGDSNMPAKALIVQGLYNDGGIARALALDSVGPSGFNFSANANAVGKPVVAFAWYLDQPRTW